MWRPKIKLQWGQDQHLNDINRSHVFDSCYSDSVITKISQISNMSKQRLKFGLDFSVGLIYDVGDRSNYNLVNSALLDDSAQNLIGNFR